MTDTNDQDTQMLHEANAKLFIVDLHQNPKLKQEWDSLLKDIKDKLPPDSSTEVYNQKYNIIANYLVNKGYNTTPELVLQQLQVDWYENYQKQSEPNKDSDRFAQDLLSNSTLLAGWQDATKKVAEGTDPEAAENFLKAEGYHCNKDQVNASIRKNRDHKLSYWAGIYGNTVLTQTGQSNGIPGPIFTIYSDKEFGVAGYVIDWFLCQVEYKDGILTWQTDAFGTQPTSGKLTFAQVSRPALNDDYVGNEFFGTLTFKSEKTIGKQTYNGEYSIMGRIGKPQVDFSHNAPIATPPKVHLSAVDTIMKYLCYVMAVVFTLDLLKSLPGRAKGIFDFFKNDVTGAGKKLYEKIKGTQATTPEEIRQTPAPAQTDPVNPGGNSGETIATIPDEILPPARDMEDMFDAAERVTREGEMSRSQEGIPETEEGARATEEVAETGRAPEIIEDYFV